jgi:8-oxo-dGTP pyrophosphatase MutT (NUDIX family)
MAASLPDLLRRRLALPLPGRQAQVRMSPQPRMWPEPGATLRPAAALLLLYPDPGAGAGTASRIPVNESVERIPVERVPADDPVGDWWMPLTVRGAALRHHGGQVSLPGGRLDHPGESIEAAALREAWEEVGVAASDVEVIGRLTPLPIAISGHLLSPVIGVARSRPRFEISAAEVDRLLELPLARLMHPDAAGSERRVSTQRPGVVMDAPYFEVDGYRVWGATAMILAEFMTLIEDIRR